MNEIKDRNPDKSNRAITILAIVFLCFSPIMYVLSIGPVGWLMKTMGYSFRTARFFYTPVIWLHDNTFLKEPLEWYTSLFGM